MRWQDLGLALLAVAAAALTILMFRSSAPPPDGVAPADGPASVASAPPPSGPAAPPRDTVPDSSTGTPSGSDDARETRQAGPAASSLPSARAVLDGDGPVVVAALGDSTGNETWEWVYGWGRALARTRPVTVLSWNEWTGQGYIEPRVLSPEGTGGQGPLTLYSGHHSGASFGYVVEHLESLLPEPVDLVVLNFGHNNTVDDVRDELEAALTALRSAVGPEVPVVLTLQQPQRDDANAEVRATVREVAVARGIGVIDVARAFEETGEPDELLADDVHPDEQGAGLWTETVARALSAP
ncbi:SGNH/GDSL hydrolase family protein [Ornithinimicrobium pekingense]|uniref:SGNH/GDSL hydrolase family protein n=1 Tax=Ornithinimicrobium pekingense TaxID=384677 RepID=UPI0003B3E411|nr:SGNH/GDSL hydrolase family protein [Ornithinimicrobium pekingense]